LELENSSSITIGRKFILFDLDVDLYIKLKYVNFSEYSGTVGLSFEYFNLMNIY